jgi:hypothetical protein
MSSGGRRPELRIFVSEREVDTPDHGTYHGTLGDRTNESAQLCVSRSTSRQSHSEMPAANSTSQAYWPNGAEFTKRPPRRLSEGPL